MAKDRLYLNPRTYNQLLLSQLPRREGTLNLARDVHISPIDSEESLQSVVPVEVEVGQLGGI